MRKTKLLPRLRAKRLHKIGRHGAVGLLVTESLICAECNKPLENERQNKQKNRRKPISTKSTLGSD